VAIVGAAASPVYKDCDRCNFTWPTGFFVLEKKLQIGLAGTLMAVREQSSSRRRFLADFLVNEVEPPVRT